MSWQLAEAKNRLSEVVTLALTSGPQRVKRRNQSVIILSETEYQRLTGARPRFKDYLMKAPSFEGLDITRDESPSRDIAL
ncbi:MAG: type II toxin-antitoxin system Phd/YefM family antitoxin [Alphaproteobacteria bacterium]|nr:type II toxin-antitoxin system Phd/YefM family antitoxin [Alphaproteobacteria bacterium]